MKNHAVEIKFIELVDIATCIPLMLIKGKPENMNERQGWIWERGGWGDTQGTYLLPIQSPELCKYDPYDYRDRTFKETLIYVQQNWDAIADGDVIDVEYILGEKPTPKQSWQYYNA